MIFPWISLFLSGAISKETVHRGDGLAAQSSLAWWLCNLQMQHKDRGLGIFYRSTLAKLEIQESSLTDPEPSDHCFCSELMHHLVCRDWPSLRASSAPLPLPPPWLSETLQWSWYFPFNTFLYMSNACHFILNVFKSPNLLVFDKVISLTLSSGNPPCIHILLKQKAPLFIFTFFHGVIKPIPKYSDLLMNLVNIFIFSKQ